MDGELPGTLRGVPNGAHSCTTGAVPPLEIEEYIANRLSEMMTWTNKELVAWLSLKPTQIHVSSFPFPQERSSGFYTKT